MAPERAGRAGHEAGGPSPSTGPDGSALVPEPPLRSLDEWFATEVGGLGILRAQQLGPAGTIEEVLRSGLRGRGGAGFPTGRKWAGVRAAEGSRRFVVVNAAEGEPGTFKDRALLRANPYQVVEGLLIAALAVGATETYVALKASFEREVDAITRAIAEFQDAGVCRDCSVVVVQGPEEYLYGEETALLQVIEGGAPLPRLVPPYQHGLWATTPSTGWEPGARRGPDAQSNPTLVNNAETLANVPRILARGADWFRSSGTVASPGTVVATVVGDVTSPGVGEVAMGTPLGEVIDAVGGGVAPGRRVQVVLPGVANAVVTSDHLDVPLTHEAFTAIGSGLGAAGFMVFDDTACVVEVARQCSQFLWVESCGQCPPCKRGSEQITTLLGRIEAGVATDRDLGQLQAWLARVTDGNRCFLAVEEQLLVSSVLRAFPAEVVEHLELGRCPRPRPVRVPKLVDLDHGSARLDDRQWTKRPDWTYP